MALIHGPYGDEEAGADISPCNDYRYRLWRFWDGDVANWAVFLMLNPSTADGHIDDPTIRKCKGFAKRWGLQGVRVINLFALRSTDPKGLLAATDPVGPDNDAHIRWVLSNLLGAEGQRVVCAWGSTGGAGVKRLIQARLPQVNAIMNELGVQPYCLGLSKDGSPRHPLMLSYETPLVPWSWEVGFHGRYET